LERLLLLWDELDEWLSLAAMALPGTRKLLK